MKPARKWYIHEAAMPYLTWQDDTQSGDHQTITRRCLGVMSHQLAGPDAFDFRAVSTCHFALLNRSAN